MSVVLDEGEIRTAINESVSAIVTAIRAALERIPGELAGGGALLRQMDQGIRAETGIPVSIADDPSCCVALAWAKCWRTFNSFAEFEVA
jgi:rod shape-determining protein MreB